MASETTHMPLAKQIVNLNSSTTVTAHTAFEAFDRGDPSRRSPHKTEAEGTSSETSHGQWHSDSGSIRRRGSGFIAAANLVYANADD